MVHSKGYPHNLHTIYLGCGFCSNLTIVFGVFFFFFLRFFFFFLRGLVCFLFVCCGGGGGGCWFC